MQLIVFAWKCYSFPRNMELAFCAWDHAEQKNKFWL